MRIRDLVVISAIILAGYALFALAALATSRAFGAAAPRGIYHVAEYVNVGQARCWAGHGPRWGWCAVTERGTGCRLLVHMEYDRMGWFAYRITAAPGAYQAHGMAVDCQAG